MAKKRKRQEEKKEEKEYRPPEFDRREYVKTEVGISKATIISAIFSLPMALVAVFIMPAGGFGAGILVGLAGIGILWVLLPRVGIDVAPFKPMQWAGIMSTYFLVFLTVWVVLCNPPFNDFAKPEIRHVQVGWDDGTGNITLRNVTAYGLEGELRVQIPRNNITIIVFAQVTDNVMVEPGSVNATRNLIERADMAGPLERGNRRYMYEAEFVNVVAGDSFKVMARDVNGHSAEYSFTIMLTN